MADVRTYDPDSGEGIGKLVREALGETIRPVQPGVPKQGNKSTETAPEPQSSVASLPSWGTVPLESE